MATITFLSADEAYKYSSTKPKAVEKVSQEIEFINEECHYVDMCEFNFYEATPVSVSELPDDIGLTLKDIFIDEASDDDIEVVGEKGPTNLGFISGTHIENKLSHNDDRCQDIETFSNLVKDNPAVTISPATFEQLINIKPPKCLVSKTNNITKLLKEVHKDLNLETSVVIEKISVQSNQPLYQTINDFEVKCEPNNLSISEEIVDENYFSMGSEKNSFSTSSTYNPRPYFTSSDEESFEGFDIMNDQIRPELKYIFKQFLKEQKKVVSKIKEFTLSGLFVQGEDSGVPFIKISNYCGQSKMSKNKYCNYKDRNGSRCTNTINNSSKKKIFTCSWCDYSCENLKILNQHNIIHDKFLHKNIKRRLKKLNHNKCM